MNYYLPVVVAETPTIIVSTSPRTASALKESIVILDAIKAFAKFKVSVTFLLASIFSKKASFKNSKFHL